jgi:hypothetical protein
MSIRAPIFTLLAALSMAASGMASAEPGSWRSQKTELVYMGFTSIYSCDGLQGKLELLLRQLGARPDFKVIASGCARGFGQPSRFARATLEFSSLQPAEAGAAPDGAGQAAGQDAAQDAAVNGAWRSLELSPRHPFDLQEGDCELMEQFRDKVLPLFATRGLQVHATCVPHQETGGPFDLQLQVFAPVTPVKSK